MDAADLPLVGGHPALDFANTLGGTIERPVERLSTYGDLLDWAAHARIASTDVLVRLAERHPEDAAAALTDTLALRAHLDSAIRAHLAGREAPADLAAVVTDYRAALSHGRLQAIGHTYDWTWPDHLDAIRWRLTVHAMDLLLHGPLDRLHGCAGCRYLFLDRSKNHSRRWCRMRGCGDAAKMRRYRARRRG